MSASEQVVIDTRPDGVELTVERGTLPGDLRLSWTPATLDLDGLPVNLQHYLVFASDTPLANTDIVDGIEAPALTLTGTSFELTPQAQARFYKVFVLDIRGNMSPH